MTRQAKLYVQPCQLCCSRNQAQINNCCLLARPWAGVTDHLAVNIGTELLGIVPGRVSTEVDAHLSYDTQATIDKVTLPDVVTISTADVALSWHWAIVSQSSLSKVLAAGLEDC